jgi:GNAT superfamily N-acetyltransferase
MPTLRPTHRSSPATAPTRADEGLSDHGSGSGNQAQAPTSGRAPSELAQHTRASREHGQGSLFRDPLGQPPEHRRLDRFLHRRSGKPVGRNRVLTDPRYRNRGIATRALQLVTAWAIESARAAQIDLPIHPEHLASQAVARNAGYVSRAPCHQAQAVGGSHIVELYTHMAVPPRMIPCENPLRGEQACRSLGHAYSRRR